MPAFAYETFSGSACAPSGERALRGLAPIFSSTEPFRLPLEMGISSTGPGHGGANGAIRPEARTGLARRRWRERPRPIQDSLRMLRAPRIEYWIQPVCISRVDVLVD